MKRDMDLVRQLLFYFEEKDNFRLVKSDDIEIEGYDSQIIAYHIHLMCEAKLLSCERVTSTTTADRLIDAYPFRLMWDGHEFLDAARSDSVWKKAKNALKDQGLSAGFGVLQALLLSLVKGQLELQ